MPIPAQSPAHAIRDVEVGPTQIWLSSGYRAPYLSRIVREVRNSRSATLSLLDLYVLKLISGHRSGVLLMPVLFVLSDPWARAIPTVANAQVPAELHLWTKQFRRGHIELKILDNQNAPARAGDLRLRKSDPKRVAQV